MRDLFVVDYEVDPISMIFNTVGTLIQNGFGSTAVDVIYGIASGQGVRSLSLCSTCAQKHSQRRRKDLKIEIPEDKMPNPVMHNGRKMTPALVTIVPEDEFQSWNLSSLSERAQYTLINYSNAITYCAFCSCRLLHTSDHVPVDFRRVSHNQMWLFMDSFYAFPRPNFGSLPNEGRCRASP